MSSFAMFLLEGGVDVAVAVDFEIVASFLESKIDLASTPLIIISRRGRIGFYRLLLGK